MAGPGAGILALLTGGKSKGMPPGEPDGDEDAGSDKGAEDSYAREAFSAMKDGDEDGFAAALIATIKACTKDYGSGGGKDDEGPGVGGY